MSIKSQIERISQNVQDTAAALGEVGAEVPESVNSDDLPGLVDSFMQKILADLDAMTFGEAE